MALVLHEHPFASFCQKVLIGLYELDLPFERVLVEDRAPLIALWPLGKIPVLFDGDLMLPESTAIIEHLDALAGGGRLVPADPAAAREARLWDRVSDEFVMNPMQKIVTDTLRPEGRNDPQGVEDARATLDTAYGVLEDRLAQSEWLGGPAFGLADCAAAPALYYARIAHAWDLGARPALTAYVRRLLARPAIARVVDEARPYRAPFPLGWPDDADALGPA